MQRLLSHVAIPKKPHYQMVGLYHGKCRDKLNCARRSLGQVDVDIGNTLDWESFLEKQGELACCEQCGKPLNQLRERKEKVPAENFSIMH